jgi:hypothetical protein
LAASGGFSLFRIGIEGVCRQAFDVTGPKMKPALFRCPTTGAMVQHMIAAAPDPSDRNRYDSVRCPACSLPHLINRATGKALGEKDPS